MSAVQTQPVFDQFNDNFVRDQAAVLSDFSSLQSKRRAEILFPTQDCARRCDRDAELARDHFCLCPLPGTGRAQENESPFHLTPVKKNRDPSDDQRRYADIEPHERATLRRFAAAVGSAIKCSPSNTPFAQKTVVMALD